jgi:hypothetical protein
MAKKMHIDKIERLAAEHESDKAEGRQGPPDEPRDEPQDDRDKIGLGRFDPTIGKQAQKSTQHPMGGDALMPVPTKAAYEQMKLAYHEAGLMRDMKDQIEQANKARWACLARYHSRRHAAFFAGGRLFIEHNRGRNVFSRNADRRRI